MYVFAPVRLKSTACHLISPDLARVTEDAEEIAAHIPFHLQGSAAFALCSSLKLAACSLSMLCCQPTMEFTL